MNTEESAKVFSLNLQFFFNKFFYMTDKTNYPIKIGDIQKYSHFYV